VKSRNLIVGILAILILFAAAARGADIGLASPEHHPSHQTLHTGEARDATASMPMDSDDGGSFAASASRSDCHPTAHGCCPGAAAVLAAPDGALLPGNGGTRIAFIPTLGLASRIDGIYKPPWLDS
jgi:hypothetical protein